MSPSATKTAQPDIVLLANANGELKEVTSVSKAETKKAPAKARTSRSKSSSKDLSAAADELLAAADQASTCLLYTSDAADE